MDAKNFALIGAGYIAPRHMRAIQDTGYNLIAALADSLATGLQTHTMSQQPEQYHLSVRARDEPADASRS